MSTVNLIIGGTKSERTEIAETLRKAFSAVVREMSIKLVYIGSQETIVTVNDLLKLRDCHLERGVKIRVLCVVSSEPPVEKTDTDLLRLKFEQRLNAGYFLSRNGSNLSFVNAWLFENVLHLENSADSAKKLDDIIRSPVDEATGLKSNDLSLFGYFPRNDIIFTSLWVSSMYKKGVSYD